MASKVQIEKIRQVIKGNRGATAKVAAKMGFSNMYVSLVLRGERNNLAIVEEAAKLARELEVKKKERLRTIEEAADSIN